MRVFYGMGFATLVLLGAAVAMVGATPTMAQETNVQRDFRALHHWASEGPIDYIPAILAELLHWGHAIREKEGQIGERHVPTKRAMILQRRDSDNEILRRYTADVTLPGGPNLILLSQIIYAPEPDTTLTYLFDKNGRIVGVFELHFDNSVQEVRDSSVDPLGYEIWALFIKQLPPQHYDK